MIVIDDLFVIRPLNWACHYQLKYRYIFTVNNIRGNHFDVSQVSRQHVCKPFSVICWCIWYSALYSQVCIERTYWKQKRNIVHEKRRRPSRCDCGSYSNNTVFIGFVCLSRTLFLVYTMRYSMSQAGRGTRDTSHDGRFVGFSI